MDHVNFLFDSSVARSIRTNGWRYGSAIGWLFGLAISWPSSVRRHGWCLKREVDPSLKSSKNLYGALSILIAITS